MLVPAIATTAAAATPAERLAALFDAHHQRLYRLGLRMLDDADEARDLVQDTFLRAAREPRRVPATEPGAEAWLVRVAVNLCRDRRRRRAVRRLHHAELPAEIAGISREGAHLARAAVRAALGRLSARRRAIVVLHELEGLTAEEIGRLLGSPAVTVRWQLAAARRELARLVGGAAGEPAEETDR